jgi:hypothetical protein
MRSRSVVQESILPLATLLLLTLVAAGPLWGPGLLNTRGGGDSPFNLMRVHQLTANLRAGVFPTRWMPDAAYGFGYPFFNYYAALPYYLAAGFNLIGVDVLSAVKLTQTIFFAAAAVGMYVWARRALRSRAGGWLAAVAYSVAPYHLVNVYVRGDSLSEFAAFAFYPLILLGLDRLGECPSLRRMIPPALAYAGLIATHNLSAFIFSLFVLLPYFVFYALRFTHHASRITPGKLLPAAALPIGSLLTGILLAAWYWLPVLAETGDVQMIAQTSGYFSYTNHFRAADLVQPSLIFDYYAMPPDKPAAFAALGLVQAILALTGVAAAILTCLRFRSAGKDWRLEISHLIFALGGLLLTTWLVTPLSRPLWDALPPLQLIQFPWRILSVQALFTALLTGAIPSLMPSHRGRWQGRQQWLIGTILALLLAVAGLAGLRPEYLSIAASEVTVERLQLYELFTGNVGTTIRSEWLPRWVVPRPFTGPTLFDPDEPPRAIPQGGELVGVAEITHAPTRRVWTVEAGTGGTEVAFPLYYWPGWRATVDGAPVEIRPTPDSGYLALTIPTGEHTIAIWLDRTPVRLAAELISLAVGLTLLGMGIITRIQEAKGRKREKPSHILFPASCIIGFAIVLTLLALFHPRVDASATDLTMDFDSQPYLHHNPGGVAFAGWRLTGYRYSIDHLAPGDALHVTLDFEAEGEPTIATLRLVSPAAVRQPELSAVATATATLSSPEAAISQARQRDLKVAATEWGSIARLDLSIPGDAGPGMYLVQAEDKTASVYLRPVWVGAGETPPGQPADATFAEDAVHLHTVDASQTASDRLDLRLDWSAKEPIFANYGISLRLADPARNEWARLDTQPGYGFLPTSLWPVDRLVHDRYTLPLPDGTPPGDAYTLTVILYHVASEKSVGKHTFPIALNRATVRPDAPVTARFGDELALSRLEMPERVRQGETLNITAYWLAVEQPAADYVAEWRLELARQTITATLPLAPGSPSSTWPAHGWVAGKAALPIPSTTPPGEYMLSFTLRNLDSGASPGSYTRPKPVRVEGHERVWNLPEMQREIGARFGAPPGGTIELAGYDLAQEGDTVKLTLYWRALAAPEHHYKFFVHVADPGTGVPATQVDAMPRGSTSPTGMWAPGEVVSDEIVLSLVDVPPGQYDLAIGWYDPDDPSQRLPAQDAAGNPLPNNHLVLPDSVRIP